MSKFSDNLKCILYNNSIYFTHYYDGRVFGGELLLYKLWTYAYYTCDDAWRSTEKFKKYPSSDIKEVVKKHYEGNLSYVDHDFSKDTYEEMSFKELPINVQNLFRRFESHQDFKISDEIQFHICNHY